MLDGILNELKLLNGFKAAFISDYSGDVLLEETKNNIYEFKALSNELNELFHNMHGLSSKYRFGSIASLQIKTDSDIIFLLCSGEEQRIHFHLYAFFELDVNQVLVIRAAESIILEVLSKNNKL